MCVCVYAGESEKAFESVALFPHTQQQKNVERNTVKHEKNNDVHLNTITHQNKIFHMYERASMSVSLRCPR